MVKKTAVVVLAYDNAVMLKSLLGQLQSQTRKPDEVIIIDNSHSGDTQALMKDVFPEFRYCKMPYNKGSAGGYYEGIKLAIEHNDAVWLLDDDVAIDPGALEELLKWLERLERNCKVGAVRSWSARDCPFNGALKMDSFAWRGTLIKSEAIKYIGLPDPDFFLYGDDVEYSYRLIKNGFSLFWVASSRVIEQRRFDKKDLSFWGMNISVYRDNAKLYYSFRNNVFLFVSYGLWRKLFRNLLYAVKLIVLFVLTGQKQKRQAVNAIFSGIRDGYAGKLGFNRKYAL